MSALDDIGATLGGIQDQLDTALRRCAAAASQADQAHSTAAALGSQSLVEEIETVRGQIEQLRHHIAGARQAADAATGSVAAAAAR